MPTVELTPVADATIDGARPNSYYGSSSSLFVKSAVWGDPEKRALLKFNLTSIPVAAAIHSAQLHLYCHVPAGATKAAYARLLTAPWAEGTVTWNQRTAVIPWGRPGGDFETLPFAAFAIPTAAGWIEPIDCVDGVAERLGTGQLSCILMSAGAFPVVEAQLYSREASASLRPKLVVEYSLAGRYNLYRGATRETVDFETRVGQARPGDSLIAEFAHRRPSGTGSYCYCLKGAGPAGHETDPHDTAYYEIEYQNGTRVTPPPAPPLSASVKPYRDGQAEFAVVVDQAAGRVPAKWLKCYNNGGSGEVDYEMPVGPAIPLPSSVGRPTVRFMIDPGLPHGTEVNWSVRGMSADLVEENNTEVYTAVVDAEGPPALSEFFVEECDA